MKKQLDFRLAEDESETGINKPEVRAEKPEAKQTKSRKPRGRKK